MQQTRKLELWVGSFIVAGMGAILFMIFQVANITSLSAGKTYTLTASFDNIGSLRVRSPVKVGGVVIGRVNSITLDTETYLPRVSMSIDSQYHSFPETSSAHILTSGLIGEQYIGITPGFVFGDENEILKDGDKIEDTKSALVLEDLIGQVLYSVGGSNDKKSGDEK